MINNKASTILLFTLALRPRGPRHPNAATPSAISLRSIHAFGVTALVKAANAVTGILKENNPPHEIHV